MNTRTMGVVVLVMMFVVMGAALSGYSNTPSQDVGVVEDSALTGGSAAGTVVDAGAGANAGDRIGRQLDRK